MNVGDKVIFTPHYGKRTTGTITRVGAKTISVKADTPWADTPRLEPRFAVPYDEDAWRRIYILTKNIKDKETEIDCLHDEIHDIIQSLKEQQT